MVKFLPKYALTVLMLAVVCLSARATIDRSAKIDSLKIVLQTVNTPGDSVKILYDILDLSTPYRNPQEAAKLLYAAAVNAGDTAVQINAIRYQANIMSGHPDYLEHLHRVISQYPPTPRTKEIKLLIELFQLENKLKNDTTGDSGKEISRLIQHYTKTPPESQYERAKFLFLVCNHLSHFTQGSLLERYASKMLDLVDGADFPIGTVQNLIYSRSAPVFTNDNKPAMAVDIDKRALNVIDSTMNAYAEEGRQYRNLDHMRYEAYTRMLANHEALTRAEVEQYYRELMKIRETNPDIREHYDGVLVRAFYSIATGDYEEAVRSILICIDRPENQRYRYYMLNALCDAAQVVGDRDILLDASLELNRMQRDELANKAMERYRELQIVYDVNELQDENARLELSKHQTSLRASRTILLVSVLGLLITIGMVIVLWRQNRKMRRLANRIRAVADHLRQDRNELRNTQRELIQARDMAKMADAQKTDFINSLSHEVKIPLATIAEYSQVIVDCIPEDKSRYLRRFADTIEVSTRMVQTMMNDLLDIAALESNTMAVHHEPVDIYKICEAALSAVFNGADSVENPAVKVVFNSANVPDAVVVTDGERLCQVLINLLSNARKATERGIIALDFTYDAETGRLTFVVTDSGPGIPDDKAEFIFRRFTKLDPNASGCGLGLYICKLLARLLGGTVELDTGCKRGARFVFSIPVNRD